MQSDRCGVYEIRCLVSGKSYVGSSRRISNRWYQHRRALNKGTHHSPRLQQAWNKHGEDRFEFSVLEECTIEELFVREQFHVDAKKRDYNSMPKVRVITKEMRAKMLAAARLKAAQCTHCPHGHEYTPENTYCGKRGKSGKQCRACARIRNAALLERSPEARERNRQRSRANYLSQGHSKRWSEEHRRKIGAAFKGRIPVEAIEASAKARASKTHCRNGHEYAVVGTVTYNGCKACKGCRADAKRRYIERLKEAA